jgi:hypothetical protein
MLGIRRDGTLHVRMADDTIAVDLAETNRVIAAEAARLRAKGLLHGEVQPIAETADGHLVFDDMHRYRFVRRDGADPQVAIYARVRRYRR